MGEHHFVECPASSVDFVGAKATDCARWFGTQTYVGVGEDNEIPGLGALAQAFGERIPEFGGGKLAGKVVLYDYGPVDGDDVQLEPRGAHGNQHPSGGEVGD